METYRPEEKNNLKGRLELWAHKAKMIWIIIRSDRIILWGGKWKVIKGILGTEVVFTYTNIDSQYIVYGIRALIGLLESVHDEEESFSILEEVKKILGEEHDFQ